MLDTQEVVGSIPAQPTSIMPTISLQGRLIEVDSQGFYRRHTDWRPAHATLLGRGMGFELRPEHLCFIDYLRSHYQAHGRLPRIREVCIAQRLTIRQIYELFPAGLSLACRLAGLPRPGCAQAPLPP